jgi:hypothetical protein
MPGFPLTRGSACRQVDAALGADTRTLLLAKHFGENAQQFTRHALRHLAKAARGVSGGGEASEASDVRR